MNHRADNSPAFNFQAIADHLPALLAYVDADEFYRYANATYEEWYRLPLSQVIGRRVQDVVGPQRYALIEPYVRRALAGEEVSYQLEYPHPDGYRRDILVRYVPEVQDGAVRGFYALISDITSSKVVDAQLAQSMTRLNEAQRIAKLGSWELDLVTNTLVWSDEIFRIFELDKDHFGASYEAFLDAIHPEDRDAVNKAYLDSLKIKSPYEITHRLRMSDGRVKWVSERCESIFDDAGKPLRSIGTVQDITERVRADQQLRETTQLLNSIVENIPNMVFLKRADDLRFALFNRAGEQLIGVKREDLLKKNDYDFFPKEQADFFTAKDRTVLAQQEVVDIPEEPIDTRQHGRRFLHTRKIALRDEHGQPRYLLGISEDITERKRAEDALRRLNEILEQRVAERTAEFIAAKQDAERANAAKTEFLSRMSHELRTPLNAILGFAQLLDEGAEPPLAERESGHVKEILRAGEHLLSLINEVLDLARVESGRVELNIESIHLSHAIRATVALMHALASERNVAFDVAAIPPLAARVLGDRKRLQQVLVNLLSNAIKYNRVGGTIAITCTTDGEERVKLSVGDSGPGIAPEQQDRLFTPFERLDADKQGIEGTGIGLAISKRFVELMGGEIGVDSTPGQGSTFWVRLRRDQG